MKKKLRVQLFDKEGRLQDDRVVEQDPEFYKGPNEKHIGPIRVELTLIQKDDVEKSIKYLQQLTGGLEIPPKKGRTSSNNLMQELEDQRKEIADEAISKKSKDRATMIKFLREYDFVFMDHSRIEDMGLKTGIKKIHQSYQFMLRLARRAKDPKSDKFDPQLCFGFQLTPEGPKYVVYLNGEKYAKGEVKISQKDTKLLNKGEAMKFPHYMTDDEREKFRREFRVLLDNPEKTASKFFIRWAEHVENIGDFKNLVKAKSK